MHGRLLLPFARAEIYRVFQECKFVEDEGDILFYKNTYGLAATCPIFPDHSGSDSSVEVDTGKEKL